MQHDVLSKEISPETVPYAGSRLAISGVLALIRRLMRLLVVILVSLYVTGIVLVQVVPLGDVGLHQIEVGPFEAPHFFHLGSFVFWGFLGAAYVHLRPDGRIRRALGWFVLGLLLAFAAEGIQHWVPYRSFTPTDLGFNLAGVILGSPALLIGFREKEEVKS